MTGILGIAVALQEKSLGLPWGWVFTWGVLSLAASVVCWLSPPATLGAIMGLIAGFAVASGVALLIGAFRLRSMGEDVKQSVRQPSPA